MCLKVQSTNRTCSVALLTVCSNHQNRPHVPLIAVSVATALPTLCQRIHFIQPSQIGDT
jgi:hypothetical protein